MTVQVYLVEKEGFEAARLHLPSTQWGDDVRRLLTTVGYTVSLLKEQSCWPDLRDAAELACVDELLDKIGV